LASVALLASCASNQADGALKQYWDFEDATTSTTLANQVAGGNTGVLYEGAVVATAPATFYSSNVPAALSHSTQSLFLGGPSYPQFPEFFSNSGWARMGSFDLNNKLTLSVWESLGPGAFGHEVGHQPWSQFPATQPAALGSNANLLGTNGSLHLLDNTGNVWLKMTDSNPYNAGWQHWALVFDPDGFEPGVSTATMYLDGVEQNTRKVSFQYEPGQAEFGLGLGLHFPDGVQGGGPLTGGFWRGHFDDLAIYDDILSPAQIAQLAAGADPASVEPPSLLGDFNEDNVVDGEDLVKWRGDFGVNAGSDADGDGDSDGGDFLIWQQQLGAGAEIVAGAAVPEASSLTLALAAMVVMASKSSRRLRVTIEEAVSV